MLGSRGYLGSPDVLRVLEQLEKERGIRDIDDQKYDVMPKQTTIESRINSSNYSNSDQGHQNTHNVTHLSGYPSDNRHVLSQLDKIKRNNNESWSTPLLDSGDGDSGETQATQPLVFTSDLGKRQVSGHEDETKVITSQCQGHSDSPNDVGNDNHGDGGSCHTGGVDAGGVGGGDDEITVKVFGSSEENQSDTTLTNSQDVSTAEAGNSGNSVADDSTVPVSLSFVRSMSQFTSFNAFVTTTVPDNTFTYKKGERSCYWFIRSLWVWLTLEERGVLETYDEHSHRVS